MRYTLPKYRQALTLQSAKAKAKAFALNSILITYTLVYSNAKCALCVYFRNKYLLVYLTLTYLSRTLQIQAAYIYIISNDTKQLFNKVKKLKYL